MPALVSSMPMPSCGKGGWGYECRKQLNQRRGRQGARTEGCERGKGPACARATVVDLERGVQKEAERVAYRTEICS